MTPSVRVKAEERLAQKIQRERELAQEQATTAKKISEKINRLRALRLAKEATDKEEADRAAVTKVRPSARKVSCLTA